MHLMYIDDSGDDGRSAASSSHFMLGGLSILDAEWRPLAKRIDAIVRDCLGAAEARRELHGSDMLSGRGFWRNVPAAKREGLFEEVLKEVGRPESPVKLFFVILHKAALPVTRVLRVIATLQMCQRFNSHLTHAGADQWGILICDEHAQMSQVKSLVSVIHSGGLPRQFHDNLIETAFFVESHESRVLQVADLLCHAVFRFVTAGDDRFFHLFEQKIHRAKEKKRSRDKKRGLVPVEIHYGFRYIAANPTDGLNRTLPFKYLKIANATKLPVGSFLNVAELEKELIAHGI